MMKDIFRSKCRSNKITYKSKLVFYKCEMAFTDSNFLFNSEVKNEFQFIIIYYLKQTAHGFMLI